MPVTDNQQTPKHVAIIMDGNGRWASKRGLPRTAGHKQGAEAARRVVRLAADMGIEYVTLFGFSSENWNRPETEIKELMSLLRYYLRSETAELHKSGAKLKVIGDRSRFDDDIVQLIENAEALTKDNTKINLIIALNYGGRHDILQAARKLGQDATEEEFSSLLMTAGIPDPDLLIRTSGEKRISNFLLWQCAYSELFFTDTLWPDFDRADLEQALREYGQRERRFGAIKQSGA
ncbi:MAG: polyprenyl diphosphate synthase [Alphaproteobacteria bacterium]